MGAGGVVAGAGSLGIQGMTWNGRKSEEGEGEGAGGGMKGGGGGGGGGDNELTETYDSFSDDDADLPLPDEGTQEGALPDGAHQQHEGAHRQSASTSSDSHNPFASPEPAVTVALHRGDSSSSAKRVGRQIEAQNLQRHIEPLPSGGGRGSGLTEVGGEGEGEGRVAQGRGQKGEERAFQYV